MCANDTRIFFLQKEATFKEKLRTSDFFFLKGMNEKHSDKFSVGWEGLEKA